VFGSGIAGRSIRYFGTPPPGRAAAFPELTAREVQILSLLARHLNNPNIGRQLGITEKTVRNNISAILSISASPTGARAIIAARDAGLGT
jgi:DNA-binding NarL/FixJ family response regulator